MELKDVILSTLAEMEEAPEVQTPSTKEESVKVVEEEFFQVENEVQTPSLTVKENGIESELIYLNSIRERLLVLFEGFQAPNNANIEAKVDMTLNFLEYTLATIDSRVQKLEKGSSK